MNLKRFFLPAIMAALTLTAAADADFITHRYDSFKACTLSNESVVFIGNSITNMGNWHEQFGDDQRIVNRGNSGACSYEAVENLESILPYHPAKIFVMIGTNDIGSATGTPESVAQYGRVLIERCKNESPETKVHIVSTFPSTNGLRNLENHAEINRLLKAVCEETGTTFIDLWDQMQGIVNNSISIDHLHVTAQGYYIWTNALLPYLGEGFTATMPSGSEAQNSYVWSNGNGLRVNMLASLPIKSSDVLMIGGEMFNNGEWHELLHNPNVKNRAATYGYGDYTVANWNTFIGYIFDLNKSIKQTPAQIYLNIGSQDINTNADMSTLKTQYRTAVNTLVAKAAGSKIHLVALTPHTDATKNAKTQEFNTFMHDLANELSLTYVDIFTPCALADGSANPDYITTELNAPYASARGYLQIARTLAPMIGNCTVDSEEEFAPRYDLINARQALGNALTISYTMTPGTTTGTYALEGLDDFIAHRDEVYALLADKNADAAAISAMAEKYAVTPVLNQPVDGKYYRIRSKRGDRIFHGQGSLSVKSTPTAEADLNAENTMWKFQKRDDGSWNIINRANGKYLKYSTSGFSVAKAAPAVGFTVSAHNISGTYVIVAGTNQLHQATAGNSWGILNWGEGRTDDEGCAFYIEELPADLQDALAEVVAPTGKNGRAYDLMGRRVNRHHTSGIVIVDGAKYLMR